MATVITWLVKQTINTQPWAEVGVIEGDDPNGPVYMSSKKFFLGGLLAVLTSLFMLFFSAYRIRMEYPDWVPLDDPQILWINTVLLILASIFFQQAKNAAQRNDEGGIRVGLVMAGMFTFCFLYGQYWAWQQIHDQGLFIYSNPANAFFYVLTGVHALHIIGGLWVWARSTMKVWSGQEASAVKSSVELCTLYWHFLLVVWLMMFYLLLST
jgi:cytochrome c oxidase subunit III